jgi:hypothetical protein
LLERMARNGDVTRIERGIYQRAQTATGGNGEIDGKTPWWE